MAGEQPNKAQRIAVVRFSALGDVAMCRGPLYAACMANPDTEYVFVTASGRGSLLLNRPSNLRVVEADLRGRHKGLRGLWRLMRHIGPITGFIDLHNVLRTRIMGAMARLRGVRVTVFDKQRAAKRALVRRGAAAANPVSNTVLRYAQALGLDTDRLHMPGLFDAAIPPSPLPVRHPAVGIAPFAAHQGKIYPPSKMLEVAHLLAQQGYTLYLFGGGAKETDILTSWVQQLPPQSAVCVAGQRLGFEAELKLMANLDAVICMDSGNMHMATMAGTPTVSVWGATHPAAGFAPLPCGPRGQSVVVQKDMPCRPCSVFGNKPCQRADYACLHGITPQDIAQATTAVVEAQKPQ